MGVGPAARLWTHNAGREDCKGLLTMPRLDRVLETVLYVDDFDRACPFYEQILGLPAIYTDQRLHAYDVGGNGVLLLFRRG